MTERIRRLKSLIAICAMNVRVWQRMQKRAEKELASASR